MVIQWIHLETCKVTCCGPAGGGSMIPLAASCLQYTEVTTDRILATSLPSRNLPYLQITARKLFLIGKRI